MLAQPWILHLRRVPQEDLPGGWLVSRSTWAKLCPGPPRSGPLRATSCTVAPQLGHRGVGGGYVWQLLWPHRGAVSLPFFSGQPEPRCQLSLPPPSVHSSSARSRGWGCWGRGGLRHGVAISGQTMASFSSPNETFPLPNSSALSLAVVFVDNSYNEEAIKKSRMGCPAASPYPFQKERLPARAEAFMAAPWTRGPGAGTCSTAALLNPHSLKMPGHRPGAQENKW